MSIPTKDDSIQRSILEVLESAKLAPNALTQVRDLLSKLAPARDVVRPSNRFIVPDEKAAKITELLRPHIDPDQLATLQEVMRTGVYDRSVGRDDELQPGATAGPPPFKGMPEPGGTLAGDAALKRARVETRDVIPSGLAFDSAEGYFAAALRMMGVAVRNMNRRDLRPAFLAKRRDRIEQGRPLIATDASSAESFARRYPGSAKIKPAM